ncbi:tetratricopeptide repeat protein [Paenibacillus sp. 1P07SE]|uniref:tetratricopeptide repeat protein n=1 Tax=Paenibacillus sp. 1P07SE TaxID=3132209 RepID=UPI0039A7673A
MPKIVWGIIKLVAVVIVIGAAFSVNWVAGIAAVALLVGYVYYSNRFALYAMKANVAYTRGQKGKALALLEKTTRQPSAHPRQFIQYGYVLMKEGELERAEQVLREGLRKSGEREDIMQIKINLATVFWLQDKRAEALELLENVFQSFKTTMVYGNLGYLKLLSGQLEEALAFNLEAYEYNGEDQTIRDNLAQTYYLLGRYEEAEQMYVKVMEKSPKYAESYYYYALTLQQLGKMEEARTQSATALERSPALIPSVTKADLERLAGELGQGEAMPAQQ